MRSTVLFCLLLLVVGIGHADTFLAKTATQWLDDLRADKATTRRSAAFALHRLGSVEALGDLAKVLSSDPEISVREMAAWAIGGIILKSPTSAASQSRKIIPVLETAIKRETNIGVLRNVVYAIGCFGESGASLVEPVSQQTDHRNAGVRQNAAWALGRLGAKADKIALGRLTEKLRDPSSLVRRDVATAIENIAKRYDKAKMKDTTRALLTMLGEESDITVIKSGLSALASLTTKEDIDFAPKLYPFLNSKDEETARAAAFVLSNMGGEAARRAVRVLGAALKDPDPGVVALAAAGLGNAGAHALTEGAALAKVIRSSPSMEARRNAALAAGRIAEALHEQRLDSEVDSFAEATVPALAELLEATTDDAKNRNGLEEARLYAAESLGMIRHPQNAKALPAIGRVLAKDRSGDVRHRCVWALFTCQDLEATGLVPILTKVLDETSESTKLLRYDTARVMAIKLRDKVPDKVGETLLEMLKDKTLRVYDGAISSVDGLGDESKGGKASITSSASGDGRFMAAEALGQMKDKASGNKRIMDALKAAASDDDERLQKTAKEALKNLGE
jgi:HEAT repeat protein